MYWLLLLALANLGLGAYDAYLTQKRMKQYGVEIELNAAIRWLSTQTGPETGAYIGIILPAFLQSLVGMSFNLGLALAVLVGFRLRFFYTQLQSHKVEKHVIKFAKQIERAKSRATLPPSESTDKDLAPYSKDDDESI